MSRTVIILATIGFVVGGAAMGSLIWLGMVTPDTFIVAGAEMRDSHRDTIERLHLLEEGEQVRWFYSDALMDIEEGMVLVTDRNLILYRETEDPPAVTVPFEAITYLYIEKSGSMLIDSYVSFTWEDAEGSISIDLFPLSAEKGLDQLVYDELRASCPNLEED